MHQYARGHLCQNARGHVRQYARGHVHQNARDHVCQNARGHMRQHARGHIHQHARGHVRQHARGHMHQYAEVMCANMLEVTCARGHIYQHARGHASTCWRSHTPGYLTLDDTELQTIPPNTSIGHTPHFPNLSKSSLTPQLTKTTKPSYPATDHIKALHNTMPIDHTSQRTQLSSHKLHRPLNSPNLTIPLLHTQHHIPSYTPTYL